VGCGFTGTSAFFQLVDRYPVREITIFEASGEFGPGYPYQPSECPEYLINNTNDTMCLRASNRRAFVEWLRARPGLAPGLDEGGHLPRAVYGAFLEDVFCSARTVAAVKGIRTRLVPAEVVDIAEGADGRVTLTWRDGAIAADAAVLSTGRCPNLNAYEAPAPGMSARYYPTHNPGRVLDDIPLHAECHVLGASLSAYDVVNKLFSPETGCRFEPDEAGVLQFRPGPNGRHVVLCSRSGRLKKVQSRRSAAIVRRHFTTPGITGLAERGEATLANIAALAVRDAAENGVAIDWAAVLDPYDGCHGEEAVNRRARELVAEALAAAKSDPASKQNFLVDLVADAQATLWDAFASGALPAAEERAYRTRFETAMLTYAAPCPAPTAERVLALMCAGRLRILRGVTGVSLNPADDCYDILHGAGVARARVLINTSGAVDRRVRSTRQPPLIARLRERGLLRPYVKGGVEMDGAAVDMATFRAEGARSLHVANMFLWGPGFFTSSAFTMASVVERLLEAMFQQCHRR
jgi:uncharacterized NAD(P)/FAD-binding protein YdhS